MLVVRPETRQFQRRSRSGCETPSAGPAFEKSIANFSEQFGWEQAADQAGEAGEASE